MKVSAGKTVQWQILYNIVALSYGGKQDAIVYLALKKMNANALSPHGQASSHAGNPAIFIEVIVKLPTVPSRQTRVVSRLHEREEGGHYPARPHRDQKSP